MSIFNFTQVLALGDIDKSTLVRHLPPEALRRELPANHIHKLQSRFRELGFDYMIGNVDGCFNHKLRAAVLAFQHQASFEQRLVRDWHTGLCTWKTVRRTWRGERNGLVDEPTASELRVWLENGYQNSAPHALRKIGHTWVRPEVADALARVSEKLHALGAYFPPDAIAGFRNPANIDRSIGMKAQSLHCAGLAIDFDEWRGMQKPDLDLFYVSQSGSRSFWTVYMRSINTDILESNVDAFYYDTTSRSFSVAAVRGRFLDITNELINENLIPIEPHHGWEKEYYKAEWWHFELLARKDWVESMEGIGYAEDYLREMGCF